MKLIGSVRTFDAHGERPGFRVSYYHRVALGLESDTTVYAVAVPRPEGAPRGYNELLMTTIHPRSWGALWRLSLVLRERTKLVKDFTDRIVHLSETPQVNISILETITTEAHNVHAVLAVLDLTGVPGADDDNAPQEISDEGDHPLANWVRGLIESMQGDETEFELHKPNTFTRLNRLYSLYKRIGGAPFTLQGEVQEKKIRFAKSALTSFLRDHICPSGSGQDKVLPTRYLAFSDTEEKHLTLFFPNEEDVLMRASVMHRDQPGAIHAFASEFGEANIINSYSRLQRTTEAAQWKFTLDVTGCQSCASIVNDVSESSDAFIMFDELELSYTASAKKRESDKAIDPGYSLKNRGPFVGRGSKVDTIIRHCTRANYEDVLINGYFGTGKTSLLRKVGEEMQSEGSLLVVHVPLRAELRSDFERFFWEACVCILVEAYGAFASGERADPETDGLRQELKALFRADGEHREWVEAVPVLKSLGFDHLIGPGESYPEVLERIVRQCQRRGRRVVLLVDDVHGFAAKGDGPGSSSEHGDFMSAWKEVSQQADGLSAVMTSATHCLGTRLTERPALARPALIDLTPLERGEAEELVSDPFQDKEVFVAPSAVDRILHVTCRQPFYIQALCENLTILLNATPENVDIITRGMVDDVLDKTASDLGRHFSHMYEELVNFGHEDRLKQLLRAGARALRGRRSDATEPEECRVSEILLRPREATVSVIPGFCIAQQAAGEEKQVRMTPLFAHWYSRGSG